MNRQPVLEGERLLLRPLRSDKWDALFAVAADPLIWRQHPRSTLSAGEDKARWDERLKKVASHP